MAACFSDTGSKCGSSLAVVIDNLRPSPIVIFVTEPLSLQLLSLTRLRNERDQSSTAMSSSSPLASSALSACSITIRPPFLSATLGSGHPVTSSAIALERTVGRENGVQMTHKQQSFAIA